MNAMDDNVALTLLMGIVEATKEMRALQKQYVASRDSKVGEEACIAEDGVDRMLAMYDRHYGAQQSVAQEEM